MSFVQQAGSDPSRVWKLGVVFSLGLMLVFELLAALSAGAGAAWGEQFGKPWFILAITVVIFAFALSLFGVWTIQLPGSVNDLSGKVQGEGYTASFLKGMLTTVLATPCAGPWLGGVVGWTLRQPAPVIFAVFTCIGVGMSLPYLVLSFNPRLMRFMPRPGAWMETFERAMGFVLMGSVVYFLVVLHGQLGGEALLATIAFLLAVAFAVWLIAVLSNPARDVPRPLVGWVLGLAAVAGAHWAAYSYLWPTPRLSVVAVQAPGSVKDPAQLTWVPYSRNRLAQLVASGKTVHVDFTAIWCPNCILMEKTVLNTAATKKVVDELGVVNMKADWSDGESEVGQDIGELLRALRSPSIPIQAIFAPGDLYHPIVIRDIFTHEQFADALRRAAGRATAGTK
jgi:thiol:disulfide interchange protein